MSGRLAYSGRRCSVSWLPSFLSALTLFMYFKPRNHQRLPQIPQRWVVLSLLLSVLALSAYIVSWATADFQKRRWLDIYDEYSCKRPPFSIWRLFSRLEHLEQENHHTFMSAPGSNVMMVQHCVYPTKRMLMPLETHRVRSRSKQKNAG